MVELHIIEKEKRVKMENQNYFAMIGDMVSSRQIKDRSEVQSKFTAVLEAINKHYRFDLASKFVVTLGDEFQGVLHSAANICEIIDTISTNLYPVRFRFGVGIGKITTEINPESSLGADGPGYWYAREAINYIHENNDHGRGRVRVSSNNEDNFRLINASLAVNDLIFGNWRKSQINLLQELVDSGLYRADFEQVMLVAKLGITAATVSKRVSSAGIKVYIRNAKAISVAINEIGAVN